ncbi:MAG: UPF0280 family protein [Pseudomonadota bacterium]
MFDNRTYREKSRRKGLVQFTVTVKETDLHIQAQSDLSRKAVESVLECRGHIEGYIARNPEFLTSMVPVKPVFPTPTIVGKMIDAGQRTGVGPMAAVAGAVAEFTGTKLLEDSSEIIVENGGDIFIKINSEAVFGIYAGTSPLSMRTGVRVNRPGTPFALCTSSGTLGHSVSFGRADAATVISESACIADAAATALGNRVKKESDIAAAIKTGQRMDGVLGIIIIKGKHLGAWGDVELVRLP